jgi:hypothetical protein
MTSRKRAHVLQGGGGGGGAGAGLAGLEQSLRASASSSLMRCDILSAIVGRYRVSSQPELGVGQIGLVQNIHQIQIGSTLPRTDSCAQARAHAHTRTRINRPHVARERQPVSPATAALVMWPR